MESQNETRRSRETEWDGGRTSERDTRRGLNGIANRLRREICFLRPSRGPPAGWLLDATLNLDCVTVRAFPPCETHGPRLYRVYPVFNASTNEATFLTSTRWFWGNSWEAVVQGIFDACFYYRPTSSFEGANIRHVEYGFCDTSEARSVEKEFWIRSPQNEQFRFLLYRKEICFETDRPETNHLDPSL